jgi:hypothetical protein
MPSTPFSSRHTSARGQGREGMVSRPAPAGQPRRIRRRTRRFARRSPSWPTGFVQGRICGSRCGSSSTSSICFRVTSWARAIGVRPQSTGDSRADAYLGALAEHQAATGELERPEWAVESERFLDRFWFVSVVPGFRAYSETVLTAQRGSSSRSFRPITAGAPVPSWIERWFYGTEGHRFES